MASSYDLIITKTAEKGFDDICTYITEKLYNLEAANKLASRVKKDLVSLKEFPEMHPVFYENHRRCIIENIIALYRIDEIKKQIIVTDIFDSRTNHIAQDPFYSEENQKALKKSIRQHKAGKIVMRKLK